MSSEAIVTTPPDVVRILASSTVFVKASSRVNRDFPGIAILRIRDFLSSDALQFRRATEDSLWFSTVGMQSGLELLRGDY